MRCMNSILRKCAQVKKEGRCSDQCHRCDAYRHDRRRGMVYWIEEVVLDGLESVLNICARISHSLSWWLQAGIPLSSWTVNSWAMGAVKDRKPACDYCTITLHIGVVSWQNCWKTGTFSSRSPTGAGLQNYSLLARIVKLYSQTQWCLLEMFTELKMEQTS